MKKLIIVLFASLLVSTTISAQIQPQKQEQYITIASQSMYMDIVHCSVIIVLPETLPMYFLRVTTANEYDDAMLFPIGDNLQEAVQSLDNILALFSEPIGSVYTMPLIDGEATVKVKKDDMTFAKNPVLLSLTAEGYAGDSALSHKKFSKIVDTVKKYAETHKETEN